MFVELEIAKTQAKWFNEFQIEKKVMKKSHTN